MPVLIRLTTILFPINLERATATPTDIPIKRLMRVAIPETSSDRRVIPMTSGSRVIKRKKAFLIPSKIRSISKPQISNTKNLLEEARSLGLKQIFVLTDCLDFFRRLGFKEFPREQLHPRIWADCVKCLKYPDCDEIPMMLELPETP